MGWAAFRESLGPSGRATAGVQAGPSPQLLRRLYWPQGLTRPSQGARPLLATAIMPHSQAGPGPGPLMPQSQHQNALRGPGRLLFVQRVPRCPGKHSGEGDSGARKGGHDEDHNTASWARATLRAETTGQAQWGPHRGQGLSLALASTCPCWVGPAGLWELASSCTRGQLAQSWGQRSWTAAAARTATRVSTMKTTPAVHTL